MKEKTHFKKAFDSPYLSSDDIVEDTILTIARVELLKDKTKKTGDMFNTAFFVEKEIRKGEPLRPMILNKTNSKTMKQLTGSPYIDDWVNIPVTIYVDNNVRMMGQTVDGLRISTIKAKKEMAKLEINTPAFDRAVTSYLNLGNLDKVKQHVVVTEQVEQAIIEAAQEIEAKNAVD